MNEVATQTAEDVSLPIDPNDSVELFVINLCASMAPMPDVPKNLKGLEQYKLYQVSRVEDGRRRYRLRLGFFTSEADAEWALTAVRSLYPAAFTGCANQEDRRHGPSATKPAVAAVTQSAPIAVRPSPPSASPPSKTSPTGAPTPSKTVTPRNQTAQPAASDPVRLPANANNAPAAKKLELVDLPAPKAATPAASGAFHVGRGVEIPETTLELTQEPIVPAAPPPKQSSAQPTSPSKPAVATPPKQVIPTPKSAAVTPTPAVRTAAATPTKPNAPSAAKSAPIMSASIQNMPKQVDEYIPILDTTLTIRTLTRAEADDPNKPKWFVVQLAISEQPINLDTMPTLDIFEAYRVYSVALMENGSIHHALRLGFFKEKVSADAVMGYLKTFFTAPTVTQISGAEHDRFEEAKPIAKPQSTVPKDATVLQLDTRRVPQPTSATAVTPTKVVATKPAATKTSTKVTPSATAAQMNAVKPGGDARRPQSFLSRLIGRQLD